MNSHAVKKVCVVLSLVLVSVFLWFFHVFLSYGDVYEKTSPDDYLVIEGNFENNEPLAFVQSFFPEQLEDSFSQIVYHYKAKKGDGYAFECYLEFVIEDPDAYTAFIEQHVDRVSSGIFTYDPVFWEKSISNILYLQEPDENEAVYQIEKAKIGKILFSEQQQRIIFVAIGVYDGGGTNTTELNHFFSRFKIDPWQYFMNAPSSPILEE